MVSLQLNVYLLWFLCFRGFASCGGGFLHWTFFLRFDWSYWGIFIKFYILFKLLAIQNRLGDVVVYQWLKWLKTSVDQRLMSVIQHLIKNLTSFSRHLILNVGQPTFDKESHVDRPAFDPKHLLILNVGQTTSNKESSIDQSTFDPKRRLTLSVGQPSFNPKHRLTNASRWSVDIWWNINTLDLCFCLTVDATSTLWSTVSAFEGQHIGPLFGLYIIHITNWIIFLPLILDFTSYILLIESSFI